jgi:site-specific DNA-cytosine methylase
MNLDQFEELNVSENLLRRVIGESVPPLLINAIFRELGM